MDIIITVIIAVICIYLAAIYPNLSRKDQLRPYEQTLIAHRGLFNNQDVPENSLTAFRKAVGKGFGIELDLQLTSDDQIVVFHDVSLKRMTGIDKKLSDCTYEELCSYPLLDTDERIPLFKDVLQVLHKDTPLVVEIKPEGRAIETAARAIPMLQEYGGLFNMESFNPQVVNYLKVHHPAIIRGQLAYDYTKDNNSKLPMIVKFFLTYMLLNFWARPDYIAYDCNATYNLSFRIISKLFGGKCIAWTIKSEEDLKKNSRWYDCFIFDSFIPDKKTDN